MKRQYLIWDTRCTPAQDRPAMVEKLAQYYTGAKPATGPDVRSWKAPPGVIPFSYGVR